MISIIIPCYNYEKFIDECIKSCLGQADEIIVIDDASTDGSVEKIKKYPVALIELKENKGYSNAKNEGIRAAKGDYIVHIDADDMLTPESVKKRLDVFLKFPGTEIVHGYALKIYDDIKYYDALKNIKKLERHPSRLHAQGFMIKKSVFEKHGLYYSKLRSKGDKEYWYRIGIHDKSPLDKIVNIRRCHQDVAFYRRHENAMHKMRKVNKQYNDEVESLFEKRIKQLQKDGITKENTEWLA